MVLEFWVLTISLVSTPHSEFRRVTIYLSRRAQPNLNGEKLGGAVVMATV